VACVGVFLNADAAFVREILASVPLNVLQFHGEEPSEACKRFGRPYIKAVAMGADSDVLGYMARYPEAAGFLLDSHLPGQAVDNVAQAVRKIRPYGVDVSSGVERAKGIKDVAKIAAFINEVKLVDCNQG
jgi:phosphoribosylanthranilate isomerase